jgi:hypothetical protein
MNNQAATNGNQDDRLDTFAAELTAAAYPIALKYGVSGSSLDLELEIWKTIIAFLHKRRRELFPPPAAKRVRRFERAPSGRLPRHETDGAGLHEHEPKK